MEKFTTEEFGYNEFFNIPENVKPFEPKPEGTIVEKPEIACNPFKCVIFPISTHIQHMQDDFTTPELIVTDKDGNNIVVSSLEELLEALENGAEIVTLSDDIILDKGNITLTNDVTLDLAGHTISADVPENKTQYSALDIDGANVILKGGSVKASSSDFNAAVAVKSGSLVIEDGIYEGPEEGSCIYAHTANASVEILDGEFSSKSDYKGKWYVLNVKDKSGAKIVVKGGKYINFDPAHALSENPEANFVAEGYESVKVSDSPLTYEVKKQEEISDDTEIKVDGPIGVEMSKEGEEKVGEIVTTSIALEPGEYEGKMVRVRVTITPAGANKPKYKEGDEWLDLPLVNEGDDTKDVFYFGAPTGFPLTSGATSEFSNELLKSGKVTTTLEVIDVESGDVISTATQIVNVKE